MSECFAHGTCNTIRQVTQGFGFDAYYIFANVFHGTEDGNKILEFSDFVIW